MDWLISLFLLAQQEVPGEVAGQAAGPEGGGGAASGGPSPMCGGDGMMFQLLMIGAIFVVFWLLFIRPQQKRAQQHQTMLKALEKGDTVYTQGGIYGRVAGLTDNTVTLEVAKVDAKSGGEVRIRVLRSAVGGKQTPTSDGGEAKDAEAVRQSQKS